MGFMELARQRYSVREFSSERPSQGVLDQLLECLLVAPTAKNMQPERVYVLQSDEALAKVDTITKCRYGAPIVLLFAYDQTKDYQNPWEPQFHSGEQDVSIVATHVMLRAVELGLGTTWVNWYHVSESERLFGLPKSERSVLLMPVGYPAEGARPSRSHTQSRPFSDLVRCR